MSLLTTLLDPTAPATTQLDWKNSCRLASNSNTNWTTSASANFLTASKELVITGLTAGASLGLFDGVEPSVNDRLLIKDMSTMFSVETDSSPEASPNIYNGLWAVTDGDSTILVLKRTFDADQDKEVNSGMTLVTEEGTSSNQQFQLTSPDPISLNVSNQVFVQSSGFDTSLGDIAALIPDDGAFIVGDGANWKAGFGNDVSTLLGLGIGDRARFAHILLNGSIPFIPKALIEATGSLVKDTANCTSSGAGNRDIACIGHGFIVGDAVGLPSGAASAQEVFTVAAVADSDNYTVDSDLTNAIVAVPGQQDPSMMIFSTGDLKKRFEVDKSGIVNIIGPGSNGRGGQLRFEGTVLGATITGGVVGLGDLQIITGNALTLQSASEVLLKNSIAAAGGVTIAGSVGVVIKTTTGDGGDIDIQPKAGNIDCSSTTGAVILTRMTTTQRDALTAINGMIIYNLTANAFQKRENGAWVTT